MGYANGITTTRTRRATTRVGLFHAPTGGEVQLN